MSTSKSKIKVKKYYHFGEDKPPIHFRPGTSDETIINSILINRQEYIFPYKCDSFDPELIFDMGANIGVTAVIFAQLYPMAKIICFEPQPDNLTILAKNVAPYDNITVKPFGLAAQTGQKKLWPSADPKNHGGFSNFIQHGEPEIFAVEGIRGIVERYGVPDLIKIDVEGAECEILRNFPHLERVSWIAGELHCEDAEFLMLHTLSVNFRLQLQRNFFDKTWHFHALNKAWEDFGRMTPKPTPDDGEKDVAAPKDATPQ